MKKVLIFLSTLFILALSSGCSATWEGIQEDTENLYDSTSDAFRDITS